MLLPHDRFFSETHFWIKRVENELMIGITDYAQDCIGAIEYLDLPVAGSQLNKGACFASAESSKAVTDILAPLDAAIVEVNMLLDDEPAVINESPYEAGWILRVTDYKEEELEGLMDSAAYAELLKSLSIP